MYDLELEFRELCLPQDIYVMYYLELEITFIPRYLHYVLFKIRELCLSQDL